jgi:hypothetical protein
MKMKLPPGLLIAATTFAVALVRGQTTPPPSGDYIPPVPLEKISDEPRNRIGISYRMGLNIHADFKKLGGVAASSNPNSHTDPAHTNTTIRTYDSGSYVGTDITGNDHGPGFENTTWYWGYASGGSVQGNSLVLSSSSSPANGVTKDSNDGPQSGVEITYDHEFFRKNKWRFGLESAFGYMRISAGDNRTLTAMVNRITDTYTIPGGVIVPPPGHAGTYEGPGAVIGADPSGHTQTMTTQAGDTIEGSRSLDSNVFSFRLGPYVEYPLSQRFSLLFSGGLYLVVGDSHFEFREKVTIVDPVTGVATVENHSGSSSQTDFLVGGYVGMNVMYSLTKNVDLFVGAQLESGGRSVTHSSGKEAVLNMGKSVVVSIGASYSF